MQGHQCSSGKHFRRENRMNKIILAGIILGVIATSGCEPEKSYEVTLNPRGDVIERTVQIFCQNNTASSDDATHRDCNRDETAAIAESYKNADITNDGESHIVRGAFYNSMPNDIGGAGWYQNISTTLGNAGFYMERFRGHDDIADAVEKKLQAADQLTDLIIGWCRAQFKSEPESKKLIRFLDQNVRRDLQNAGIYSWTIARFHADKSEGDEFIAYLGPYIIERGYLKSEEAFKYLWGSPSEEEVCLSLQRLFAKKMGVKGKKLLPRSLALFNNAQAVKDSWSRYLCRTDLYQRQLRNWKERLAKNPGETKPDPTSISEKLFDTIFESGNSRPDTLTVRLLLPFAPMDTNGVWDEAARQVVWKARLEARNENNNLPVSCYAGWASPQEDFQKAHFGGMFLVNNDLREYCIWRSSLDANNGAEWDNYLSKLRPDDDAVNQLKQFRFTTERSSINGSILNLDKGKNLIISALQRNRR
jgi:hypothetical protein